ncbi:Rx, N-terminal [Dillenia turbinata]|uniref:Rx, N-terminal n=1 Tax=Dillenia turbinata TaxID=194707 RepID=A0AAN8V5B2_9MAGN
MGEPLLTAYLQSLLDKLASGPLMNFSIQEGFDSELRKWRSMLRKIKLVLGDAEEKQMNDIEVKRWMDDLLLAYDADDALDDFDYEALHQQNNSSSDPATRSSQLLNMLPLIKRITARFQDIEEQKSDLGLEAKCGVRSSIINKRFETTSLLDSSEVVGREQDVIAILKLMGLSETTEAEGHFIALKNTKKLRTLLALSIEGMRICCFINKKLLHDLLSQLRYLRVFSLSSYQIRELPSSITHLKYLRYLNLSYTKIQVLLEFLCDLHFLQFLILKGCRYFQQLPLRMTDLTNFRHLDITDTPKLQELSPRVVNLKFLQKLTNFFVGEDDTLRLKELKMLHHLIGTFMISGLDKVKDIDDVVVINLKDKKNIEKLELQWVCGFNNTENTKSQIKILNLLEPHKMLRKLVINGYCGLSFSNWIGDSSYSKLVKLSLVNCERCKSLLSLGGLSQLEEVKIEGMLEVETIGRELYGEASPHGGHFPSLKTLEFENMPKWVNWSLPVGITSLLHLRITNCPELVVPVLSMLPSLRELRFFNVKDISNGLHCPTSLTELYIAQCQNLLALPDGIISNNSKLQVLDIFGCESLESFPSGVLPSTLKTLKIWNCRKLESISEMLLSPTSLHRIEFGDYPNLKSLPKCLCTDLTFLLIIESSVEEKLKEKAEELNSLHFVPEYRSIWGN